MGSSGTWTSICFLIGWAASREEINTHAEACTVSPNEIHSTAGIGLKLISHLIFINTKASKTKERKSAKLF